MTLACGGGDFRAENVLFIHRRSSNRQKKKIQKSKYYENYILYIIQLSI